MNKLSILNIVRDTTVDGPGFRTAIYGAGCIHKCIGCHNPQSWNIGCGSMYSIDELVRTINDDEFADVTFSGGDPLMQVEGFTTLAREIKRTSGKNIWCYTGYLYEQILRNPRLIQILPYIDVLVDGRYVTELRDEDLLFRGSSNQRLIDVQRSLKENKTCIWNNEYNNISPFELYASVQADCTNIFSL